MHVHVVWSTGKVRHGTELKSIDAYLYKALYKYKVLWDRNILAIESLNL